MFNDEATEYQKFFEEQQQQLLLQHDEPDLLGCTSSSDTIIEKHLANANWQLNDPYEDEDIIINPQPITLRACDHEQELELLRRRVQSLNEEVAKLERERSEDQLQLQKISDRNHRITLNYGEMTEQFEIIERAFKRSQQLRLQLEKDLLHHTPKKNVDETKFPLVFREWREEYVQELLQTRENPNNCRRSKRTKKRRLFQEFDTTGSPIV